MGRIIFFLLLGAAIYIAVRWWMGQQRIEQGRRADRAQGTAGEAMVSCSLCGLNVPQSDALSAGGRWYCSEEHKRKHEAG